MNLLARLNIQGQAARRNLAMRGAQAQRQAQSELMGVSMNADARRQDRQQLWERQMAAMDAARRQYNAQAAMAPIQGAMAFMPIQGMQFTKGQRPEIVNPATETGYTPPSVFKRGYGNTYGGKDTPYYTPLPEYTY
jgi:hypothetical protein